MQALTPDSSLLELVDEHPFLIEFLASYNPRFGLLRNPVMRNTAGRVATLRRVAELGGVGLQGLMDAIQGEIRRHHDASSQAGAGSDVGGKGGNGAGSGGGIDEDRVAELKSLIQDLHDGLSPEEAQARFDETIKDVSAQEIGVMEEQLIRDGMAVEEVQRLCDLHVKVVRAGLDRTEEVHAPPGHPVHVYMAENRIITELANRLGSSAVEGEGGDADPDWAVSLGATLEELTGLHNHYLRKENELFPVLERYGITGPSKVMWGIHDDIRRQLKDLRGALDEGQREEVSTAAAGLARSVIEMVYKENKILLPLAMETLTAGEWAEIRKGEDELGYAFAPPRAPFPVGFESQGAGATGTGVSSPVSLPVLPSRPAAESRGPAGVSGPSGNALPIVSAAPTVPLPNREETYLDLGTGQLSLEQVDMILRHLPVDLSFVDADGFVRYYSETEERLFPRTPGAIGRHVTNCHPPKSVHMVEEILLAFSSGERDAAEFWIQMKGRFIHIRYFAVRNPKKEYVGCLEVSQDVTRIRALDGERRLLEWS
jgi:DUF438 domain-containing protein